MDNLNFPSEINKVISIKQTNNTKPYSYFPSRYQIQILFALSLLVSPFSLTEGLILLTLYVRCNICILFHAFSFLIKTWECI